MHLSFSYVYIDHNYVKKSVRKISLFNSILRLVNLNIPTDVITRLYELLTFLKKIILVFEE